MSNFPESVGFLVKLVSLLKQSHTSALQRWHRACASPANPVPTTCLTNIKIKKTHIKHHLKTSNGGHFNMGCLGTAAAKVWAGV